MMKIPDLVSGVAGLTATTAKVRNTTFVARNPADVERTGVRLLDLFDGPR